MHFSKHSLPLLALLWALVLVSSPLHLLQAWYVRRTARRLPDAAAPLDGVIRVAPNQSSTVSGAESDWDKPIHVLGVGDSVIAGTGIARMSDALVAQIAGQLSKRFECDVAWQARGNNGDRIADLARQLESDSYVTADYIVVSIGVNDVTTLTSLVRWQTTLLSVLDDLQKICRREIIVIGIPPMEQFTALPAPLSWALGVRAAMLGKILKQFADAMRGVIWVDPAMEFGPDMLAEDGYHPNVGACALIARSVVDTIAAPTKNDESSE